FIKEASPIVRLFHDSSEEPAVPLAARFERIGLGHYRMRDVPPLASKGWQIEVPQDANGNRLVYVHCSYDAGMAALDVRTREVIWQDGWAGGAPCDIPVGRWVDLRFDMP
ncbi:MAG TPA: phage tail protein, partial [Sulfitobacter sp.]|nr:phage tail protein [Sulfitobacter sp.]